MVWKHIFLFFVGGFIYLLMELLARGFSDITMFVLGGICFILIGKVNEYISWDLSIIVQSLIGGFLIITPLELLFGLLFNANHTIWDYTNMPFNIYGQICLPFSLLWCAISIIAIILDDYLRYWFFGEEKPRYKLF